jgi:hypothetical protein
MSRSVVRTLLAFASVCLLASSAFAAPVQLDPPDLAPGATAASLIEMDVTAGPSGAPNGFTIEWMTQAQFDALGGWPVDPTDPAIQSAIFLGFPTLNTVDGTTTFLLSPGQLASIQIGDIFDETGVQSASTSELSQGTIYVFRVKANGDPGVIGGNGSLLPASPYSPTQSCQTKPHDDRHDCVHSQGYWKEHPSDWPVTALRLGAIIYTKAQLITILNQPAHGNGLVSLAHQLIAAKLNMIAGAIAPPLVSSAVSAADALISTKVIPSIGTGYIAPSLSSHLTDTLEEFNVDETLAHTCTAITATSPRTWGQLKALYR